MLTPLLMLGLAAWAEGLRRGCRLAAEKYRPSRA
jgi:hypothetical protein